MLNHIRGRYKLYSEQEPLGIVNRFALPLNLHLILQTLSRDVCQHRGVGTGPADPATAGPKFPVHQESPQQINIIH